jgi:hypothetical protein
MQYLPCAEIGFCTGYQSVHGVEGGSEGVQAVVLVPTQELVGQVFRISSLEMDSTSKPR